LESKVPPPSVTGRRFPAAQSCGQTAGRLHRRQLQSLPGRYPACVNGRKAGGIDADLMRINRALVPIEIKVRVVGEADDRVSLSDGRL